MNPATQFIRSNYDRAYSWFSALFTHAYVSAFILVVLGYSSTQASADSAELALAQLLKDIETINTELTHQTEAADDGYYEIRRGDTLDRIIDRVIPKTSLRRSILRQAIVSANPHAFKRHNPNWMYANKRIKLPDGDDIKRVIFTATPSEKKQPETAKDRKDWVRYP